MWRRTGVTLMLRTTSCSSCHGSNSKRSNSSWSRLRQEKSSLVITRGCRNSWSQHVFVANMARDVVRDPIRSYLPGEPIPSAPGKKKAAIIKDTSMASDLGKSLRRSQAQQTATIFHNLMTDAVNARERKLIVLEGQRLVEEAFKAGLKIHKLFLRKSTKEIPLRLKDYVEQGNVPVHHVSDTAIKNWSSLTTPPGIIGVFYKPKAGELEERMGDQAGIPLTVICDNVREPGNLGSILRSAAGAGCKRVLLSKGCCDPWDPKVLRGGCGAQFYMPIMMNYPLYSLLECIQAENGSGGGGERMEGVGGEGGRNTTLVAPRERDDDGSVRNDRDRIDSCNESKSEEGIRTTTTIGGGGSRSIIPRMNPEERGDDAHPGSFALFLADSNDTQTDERKSLPIVSYTDVDYRTFGNVYLVVGGETEGLSRDILQITASLETIHPHILNSTVARLRIPLHHNMESLNASIACSVIAYEILRQYQQSNLRSIPNAAHNNTSTSGSANS